MEIIKKLAKPKHSEVYDTYWKFATERQSIFYKRLNGETDNWTKDTILRKHKFTNAYRASDRVSQYLIREVIYSGSQDPKEVIFRILLFKTFNKIETWELLKTIFPEISYKTYSYKKYETILTNAIALQSIYSGAYIMASGKSIFGFDYKHQNHLKLIEFMMKDGIEKKIQEAPSLQKLFEILLSYPTLGNFLAYQYAIDINYSNVVNFSELDFVMPGPGAKDGIKKCFITIGDYSEADVIKYMTDRQTKEFERLKLEFKNLWGRDLQLIDCQNLFCEVDKYARIAHPKVDGISGRKRIKQLFVPKESLKTVWYPPKWNLNSKIENEHGKRKECIH